MNDASPSLRAQHSGGLGPPTALAVGGASAGGGAADTTAETDADADAAADADGAAADSAAGRGVAGFDSGVAATSAALGDGATSATITRGGGTGLEVGDSVVNVERAPAARQTISPPAIAQRT